MPQRTHGPTNAAANPSADAAEPGKAEKPRKGVRRASAKSARQHGATVAPATDAAVSTLDQTAMIAPDAHPLAPELIARTLRAVAGALERDPALARRVAADAGFGGAGTPAEALIQEPSPPPDSITARPQRTFRPRIVTGPDATLGPGIPDPFALRAARGEAGLRAVLEDLRLGTLRAIIRAHHLDPSGRLARQNDAARLRGVIVEATAAGEPPSGE